MISLFRSYPKIFRNNLAAYFSGQSFAYQDQQIYMDRDAQIELVKKDIGNLEYEVVKKNISTNYGYVLSNNTLYYVDTVNEKLTSLGTLDPNSFLFKDLPKNHCATKDQLNEIQRLTKHTPQIPAYAQMRIQQASTSDNLGYLNRVFDRIAIPEEILMKQFKSAEKASRNGQIAQYLLDVVRKTSSELLTQDKKRLNPHTIKALGEANYQQLKKNFANRMGISPEKAEEAIANGFIQAITASYPQKLVDYCLALQAKHVINKEQYLNIYTNTISPMERFTSKINSQVLIKGFDKELSLEQLMHAFETIKKKTNEELVFLEKYSQWLKRHNLLTDEVSFAVKNNASVRDEIQTIDAFMDEGLSVKEKIVALLEIKLNPETSQFIELAKLHHQLDTKVANLIDYHNSLIENDVADFDFMKSEVEQVLKKVTETKKELEQSEPLDNKKEKVSQFAQNISDLIVKNNQSIINNNKERNNLSLQLDKIINNLSEYHAHFADNDCDVGKIQPVIQSTMRIVLDLKNNLTNGNLTETKDTLRRLPLIEVAEYHCQLNATNPEDTETIDCIKKLIHLKTQNILKNVNATDQNATIQLQDKFKAQLRNWRADEVVSEQQEVVLSSFHLGS